MMQKSSLSTPYVQRKRVFLGGGMLDRPWLGRSGNLKMCRSNARSPNTVGGQICKNVVPQLIDPGANKLAIHCDFCDTSRTAEATSTRKTLKIKSFFDDTSFVVLNAYL